MTNNHSKLLKKRKRNHMREIINITEEKRDDTRIRSYRMQEEYGPKKFIKP